MQVQVLNTYFGPGCVVGNTLTSQLSEGGGLNSGPGPHLGKLVIAYRCQAVYGADS